METTLGLDEMRSNRIPDLLHERRMTITQLQLDSRLPWGTVHKLATVDEIPDRTNIKTLAAIARAFGVTVDDLYNQVD